MWARLFICAIVADTALGIRWHAPPGPVPPVANETLPNIPSGLPSDDIRFQRGVDILEPPAGPPESGPAPPSPDPVLKLPDFDAMGVGEEHLKILDMPLAVNATANSTAVAEDE
ncbi:unnamed protein product [Amoebophrya sp. A25]|nr:unnamed protein product [Amoebophrya sp. A25]|eukprot:GSA25T00002080001.1